MFALSNDCKVQVYQLSMQFISLQTSSNLLPDILRLTTAITPLLNNFNSKGTTSFSILDSHPCFRPRYPESSISETWNGLKVEYQCTLVHQHLLHVETLRSQTFSHALSLLSGCFCAILTLLRAGYQLPRIQGLRQRESSAGG